MHYFIDESGDFNVPDSCNDHRVAVASCLAFTDASWEATLKGFAEFKAGLRKDELKGTEPRWHLLSTSHRETFCDLLARTKGVSLTPVTLDLSHLAGRRNDWLERMLAKLDAESELMLYDTMKEQFRELGRRARNLNPVQHLRIYTWAYCLQQALYHSIIFLGHGPDRTSWEQVNISIDPVQQRSGSREEQVFSFMVLAWLMGWSRRNPFVTVEGIHTADHPFVRLYDTGEGIDMGKLVRPNLMWQMSNASEGIQMADLTASAVYQAASELKRGSESLAHYASLMRSSFYGPARGSGLFSPLEQPPRELEGKYQILSQVMGGAAA